MKRFSTAKIGTGGRTSTPPARFFGPEKFTQGNIKPGEVFYARNKESQNLKYVFLRFQLNGYPAFNYYPSTGKSLLVMAPANCARDLFKYEQGV